MDEHRTYGVFSNCDRSAAGSTTSRSTFVNPKDCGKMNFENAPRNPDSAMSRLKPLWRGSLPGPERLLLLNPLDARPKFLQLNPSDEHK